MNDKRAVIDKILSLESRSPADLGVKLHHGLGDRYAKTFVIDGAPERAKYVCAVLNSSLARWFTQRSSKPIDEIPIPKADTSDRRRVAMLVDEILELKDADPDADTWWLEVQIDDLVYDLYGLSEEETTAIERSLGLIHQTDEEEDAALVRAMQEGAGDERGSMEELESILSEWREAGD